MRHPSRLIWINVLSRRWFHQSGKGVFEMLKKICSRLFPRKRNRASEGTTVNEPGAFLSASADMGEQKEEDVFDDAAEDAVEQAIDANGNSIEIMRAGNLVQVRCNLDYAESLGLKGCAATDRDKIEALRKTILDKGYRPSRKWCGYYKVGPCHCVIRFLPREGAVFFKIYAYDLTFGDSDVIGPPLPTVEDFVEFLEFNGG